MLPRANSVRCLGSRRHFICNLGTARAAAGEAGDIACSSGPGRACKTGNNLCGGGRDGLVCVETPGASRGLDTAPAGCRLLEDGVVDRRRVAKGRGVGQRGIDYLARTTALSARDRTAWDPARDRLWCNRTPKGAKVDRQGVARQVRRLERDRAGANVGASSAHSRAGSDHGGLRTKDGCSSQDERREKQCGFAAHRIQVPRR